jgi:hypothetical protein
MRISRLRHRIAVAGSIGAAALIATVGIAGVAGANTYNPGTNPANGVTDPAAGYPLFNNGVINADRSVGSDTTFFMMQKIGDLYTQAALYGCPLNGGAKTDSLYNGDLNTTNSGVSGPIPANGACLSGQGAARIRSVAPPPLRFRHSSVARRSPHRPPSPTARWVRPGMRRMG